MSDFTLWDKITVSSTPDEIRGLYPEARGENPIDLGTVEIFHCEFLAQWKITPDNNRVVELLFIRSLRRNSFSDIQQQIVAILSEKYGRGQKVLLNDGVYQKRWDRRHIRVLLTCADDQDYPVISIEYFRPLNLDWHKV